MSATAEQLRALRQEVAGLERWTGQGAARRVPLGHAEVDAALGGGLETGRLHELFSRAAGDVGAAAGFAAMLAARFGSGVFWLRQEQAGRQGGALHGPGLAEIGLDPAQLILGVLEDPLAVLAAAGEAARCPGVGSVVVELHGMPRALDLIATRRLALAAEGSGASVLLLRIGGEARPSAAWTRWSVSAAPSAPLEAGAPGHPALDLELTRQKSGPPGGPWRVEWDRDGASFRTWSGGGAALSGAPLPPAADGSSAPPRRAVLPLRRLG